MNDAILYELRERIAIITMNRPPLNGLGLALRQGLIDAVRRAGDDPVVDGIVLASAAGLFSSGADIAEFASGQMLAEPILPEVCAALEASPKRVVAALDGQALGGGCELALACDYRIASPGARLGLPEVHLGLIPGAGGTQRLPRLAGVPLALEMITGGRPVDAERLAQAGLVDRLHAGEGDLVDAAVAYARELASLDAPKRRCADQRVDTGELPADYFATYRAELARRTRGQHAPERAVAAVEAACELPLEAGLAREKALFLECLDTPQARAQQHLFFAQRQVGKVPGIDPRTTPVRPVGKVAVIGSGTMGGGIAMCFLNAGIPTVIVDLDDAALERGIGMVRKNYAYTVKKGRMTEVQLEQRMELLSGTTDYADLADVDLVIEAVFENMEIKKAVFRSLDACCKPGAILATNTSTLDIDAIAAVTTRPQDVIGLHFFSPANVMKLLEIVRAERTADDVLLTAVRLAERIRKVPVVSRVCWGFIGNRATEPYLRESVALLLEGVSPARIDRVHTEFGMPMGLPSVIDLAGIDVVIQTRAERKAETVDRDPSYFAVLHRLHALGRFGQKSGRGLYIYEGRDKREDPEVMEFAAECAREFGIAPREVSDQEILERTIYPMINEGARILAEGVAARSSDIDVVLAHGFGFPAYRGGPMQYADEIGLETVLERLNAYRRELPNGETWYRPAPLLVQLVAEHRTFRDVAP